MTTGSLPSVPKNAYFKCEGSGFNSTSGGSSIEGFKLALKQLSVYIDATPS